MLNIKFYLYCTCNKDETQEGAGLVWVIQSAYFQYGDTEISKKEYVATEMLEPYYEILSIKQLTEIVFFIHIKTKKYVISEIWYRRWRYYTTD